jgi:hypothetical protein
VEPLEDRRLLAVIPVTTTADEGAGSLRQAILDANVATEAVTIRFQIPNIDANFVDVDSSLDGGDANADVFVIAPLSALPQINNTSYAITLDGGTQTTFGGDTNPFGPEIVLAGSSAGADVHGLVLSSNGNHVLGLDIQEFSNNGILISGDANVVAGNYIGTDATGTLARGNAWHGIQIYTGTGNTVGGTSESARNLVSANLTNGIQVEGADTTGNSIQGNYVGTDASGTADLGNTGYGIRIYQSPGNLIGGTAEHAGNLVSGNDRCGIHVGGIDAAGNTLQRNRIGTNADATVSLGNASDGIVIDQSPDTVVGGTDAATRNIVSGNLGCGITIYGADATGNTVRGNYIGTDLTGTASLGNGYDGILIGNSPNNTIGGTSASARNLISGNLGNGIVLQGTGATANTVQGNHIGTDLTGTVDLGNAANGIAVVESSANLIGGTETGEGNLISGNNDHGIWSYGTTSAGNSVRGNSIFANDGLGIDLGSEPGDDGVTLNDLGDSDTGSNGLQNFPVLSTAVSAETTTISGALNSAANTDYWLDFYASSSADPSGYGEGQYYLGSIQVTTDDAGDASFSAEFSTIVPGSYKITATATDPQNNTSEFSTAISLGNIDADGNGSGDALTDGILILRYLFEPAGPWNYSDALGSGATRTTRPAIKSFLDGVSTSVLDVDGNGAADALTDGILILRYLFDPAGSWNYSDALGSGATRTTRPAIKAYLDLYTPIPAATSADNAGASVAVKAVETEASVVSAEASASSPTDVTVNLATAGAVPLADNMPNSPIAVEAAATDVTVRTSGQRTFVESSRAADEIPRTSVGGDPDAPPSSASPRTIDAVLRYWSHSHWSAPPVEWSNSRAFTDGTRAIGELFGEDNDDWFPTADRQQKS